jgi:hypothetical protein
VHCNAGAQAGAGDQRTYNDDGTVGSLLSAGTGSTLKSTR